MCIPCDMCFVCMCVDVDEHEWIVAHCRKGVNDGDPLKQWPRSP